MHKPHRFLLALGFATACGSDPASPFGTDGGIGATAGFSSYLPCDPFAASEQPIVLGTVLGAGRDAAGTIYVVNAKGQVFISVDGVLIRQRVAGSGTGPDFWVYSLADHTPPLTVQGNPQPDGSLRMGIFTGAMTTKTFVIGEQGEELTVLDAADVAALPVRDLPGEVVLEYAAALPDGRQLVVTRPRDDMSYTDFRLFLGDGGQLSERKVVQVQRFKDGGSTLIVFVLDRVPATASFPVEFADGGFAPGPASLETPADTLPLTRLSAAPAGATYLCGV